MFKAKMNKTQQNGKCRWCGERDETINNTISRYSKLEQKDGHDWMGKVIHWELCKKFKLDQTNEWYMHKPESVQENETHKLLWNFEIQTDHSISARRPDVMIDNQKMENLPESGFCLPGRPQSKNQRNRKERWISSSC